MDTKAAPGIYCQSCRDKDFILELKEAEVDGHLWVCDMYRLKKRHPTYLGEVRVTKALIESKLYEELVDPQIFFKNGS